MEIGPQLLVVDPLSHAPERILEAHARQDLPGGAQATILPHVAEPEVERAYPRLPSEHVRVGLYGEGRLGRSRRAKGSRLLLVGVDANPLRIHVGDVVGTDRGERRDVGVDRSLRPICPRVDHYLRLPRDDLTILDSALYPDPHRRSRRCGEELLPSREDHLDRSPRLLCEHHGERFQVAVNLRPKTPTRVCRNHLDLAHRYSEDLRQRVPEPERTLGRSPDPDPTRLLVELRGRRPRFDVALVDL